MKSDNDDPTEETREEQAYRQQLKRQVALATLFDGDADSEVAAEIHQLEVDLEQSTARHLAELRREFQERGGREASPASRRTAEVLRHAACEFDFAPDVAGLLGEVAQLIEPVDPPRRDDGTAGIGHSEPSREGTPSRRSAARPRGPEKQASTGGNMLDPNIVDEWLPLAPEMHPPREFTLHADGKVSLTLSPEFLAVLRDMVTLQIDEEIRRRERPSKKERELQARDSTEDVEWDGEYYDKLRAVVANVDMLASVAETQQRDPERIGAGKYAVDRLSPMFKKLGIKHL